MLIGESLVTAALTDMELNDSYLVTNRLLSLRKLYFGLNGSNGQILLKNSIIWVRAFSGENQTTLNLTYM